MACLPVPGLGFTKGCVRPFAPNSSTANLLTALIWAQQDVKKLVEDITVLRPTIFVGVPRVFHRIYDKITQVRFLVAIISDNH